MRYFLCKAKIKSYAAIKQKCKQRELTWATHYLLSTLAVTFLVTTRCVRSCYASSALTETCQVRQRAREYNRFTASVALRVFDGRGSLAGMVGDGDRWYGAARDREWEMVGLKSG